MWLFVNNQPCFGYIQITTLNNKNTFGTPYRFGKLSVSKSKPFQSLSKGEIPGRARRKERLSRSKLKQAIVIDLDAELFMYLIQCIRFGS